MKILLINPYLVSKIKKSLSEPMGLMCLKTYLDTCLEEGQVTEILDLYALGNGLIRPRRDHFVMGLHDEEEVKALIRSAKPDLIGITCTFSMHPEGSFEAAVLARQACPDSLIVMGGAHASLDALNIMGTHPQIDIIVRGEGELVFKNLVTEISRNQLNSLHTVDGIVFREPGGEIRRNPDQELIPDVNSLPIPDRTCVDMDFYSRITSEVWIMAKGIRSLRS